MYNKQFLCGIDEAGRGPLAGSLVIAGVVLHRHIEGLMDSKKLSEKKRESLYTKIIQNSRYHIAVYDSKQIDEVGMSVCISMGLREIMYHLPECDYLFDGNCTFGVQGITTMIKADEQITEVSAASILAKVTRDRMMMELASRYPEYEFDKHKGYGTKAHIEAIIKYGRCELHRKSFKIKGID
ncbi:MAG: ribonuclease HII [Sulfurovaceae bacterium]|nr:ribonuclease HII [Sulfurovaceae bacterium]